MTETVILPDNGKGYRIEGANLSRNVAGSTLSRQLSKQDNRVTMVSDFRHHQREISAADARAAMRELEKINEDWAYIVGPPEKKKRRQ